MLMCVSRNLSSSFLADLRCRNASAGRAVVGAGRGRSGVFLFRVLLSSAVTSGPSFPQSAFLLVLVSSARVGFPTPLISVTLSVLKVFFYFLSCLAGDRVVETAFSASVEPWVLTLWLAPAVRPRLPSSAVLMREQHLVLSRLLPATDSVASGF